MDENCIFSSLTTICIYLYKYPYSIIWSLFPVLKFRMVDRWSSIRNAGIVTPLLTCREFIYQRIDQIKGCWT